jgi:hypothetical protein
MLESSCHTFNGFGFRGVSAFHEIQIVSHDNNPSFFLFLFFLLPLHLTQAREPGFFFLLLPHLSGNGTHRRRLTQPSPTISGQLISGDVLHFRPNPTMQRIQSQLLFEQRNIQGNLLIFKVNMFDSCCRVLRLDVVLKPQDLTWVFHF